MEPQLKDIKKLEIVGNIGYSKMDSNEQCWLVPKLALLFILFSNTTLSIHDPLPLPCCHYPQSTQLYPRFRDGG